mmetsp:Transcript_42816/g.96701  ORF Transcript_42816/g.96701 Transcript_42816/m.96701 type:complete len:152 (-) Transcript_42816:64-519(-)
MTKQNYAEIGKLSTDFKDSDVVFLLFPCNQFLSQEPGQPSNSTARQLSRGSLDAESSPQVKMMARTEVNGANASPVYEFLKYNSSLYNEKTGKATPIPWNFAKFLVCPKGGGVYKYYSPRSAPESIKPDIETLLHPSTPNTVGRAPTTTLQ